MGFWKEAGNLVMKVGSVALNQGKAALERSREYQAEMPSKSDAQLVAIIKKDRSRTPLRAGAASQELKNRGYDAESIKSMIS